MIELTFAQLRYPLNYLVEEKPSAEDARALVLDMRENKAKYTEVFSANMKVKDLKKALGYHIRATKKAGMCEELLDTTIDRLARVKTLSWGLSGGSHDEALLAHFDEVFEPERWQKELDELTVEIKKADERMAEKIKGMENPVTLDDFDTRVRVQGAASLSKEQYARWDELRTEANGSYRKRLQEIYAHRMAIDLEGVAFDLIDTKHTQKGYDLFVVKFMEWLPRRLWKQTYDRAKEFDGWYSGYDKNGAITGTMFKTEAARKNYCENVLCGGRQLDAHLEQARYLATLSASERLRVQATLMLSASAEELEKADNALANTPRRARFQATAKERTYAKMALASTMHQVGEAIRENPDHILAGMKYKTDFATLKAVGDKYPMYEVSREMAERLMIESSAKGAALAFSMIRKRIREQKGDKILFNTKIVEQLMNKGVEAWWLFEQYTHRARLTRMGIEEYYELRHAQKVLSELTIYPESEPEWMQTERDLVGRKIPGFFPTPPALIRAMCDGVNLTKEDDVLDPSCGKGDILEYAIDKYNVRSALGTEISHKLYLLCRAKGLSGVRRDDALRDSVGYEGATVILMNPPFEKDAAVQHFNRAWLDCASGTRIACIMPSSVVSNQSSVYQNFRDLVADHGGEITHNPDNSFRSAFRSTDVSTVLLVITKE